MLHLCLITSNFQKEITLTSFQGFYKNANFSFPTDCVLSFITAKRMYYVITFLVYYTADSLGYYALLALFREQINHRTACSLMQCFMRFTINEDLIRKPSCILASKAVLSSQVLDFIKLHYYTHSASVICNDFIIFVAVIYLFCIFVCYYKFVICNDFIIFVAVIYLFCIFVCYYKFVICNDFIIFVAVIYLFCIFV